MDLSASIFSPATCPVAEQHVEDIVALLAAGRGGCGEGSALGCHPGTRLNAVGDQVLRLGGRGGFAIHDVAAGELGVLRKPIPRARAVVIEVFVMADSPIRVSKLLTRRTLPCRPVGTLKCFSAAFHSGPLFLRCLGRRPWTRRTQDE